MFLFLIYNYYGAHIIWFGPNGAICLMGAFYRAFYKQVRGSSARSISQHIFNVNVGQVIMDAIGAEQYAVARKQSNISYVDILRPGTSQRLCDTVSLIEVFPLHLGQIISMHGLVDAQSFGLAERVLLFLQEFYLSIIIPPNRDKDVIE